MRMNSVGRALDAPRQFSLAAVRVGARSRHVLIRLRILPQNEKFRGLLDPLPPSGSVFFWLHAGREQAALCASTTIAPIKPKPNTQPTTYDRL